MKKIIALLLSTLVLLSFTACKENDDTVGEQHKIKFAETGESKTDVEGIYLKAEGIEIVDGKTFLKTKWVNDTLHNVVYGESYTINRQENGNWVSCHINEELSFIDIAYELSGNSKTEKKYDLTNSFDISMPGTYRISSNCYVYDGNAGDGSTKCELWTEFVISETQPLEPDTPGMPINDHILDTQ